MRARRAVEPSQHAPSEPEWRVRSACARISAYQCPRITSPTPPVALSAPAPDMSRLRSTEGGSEQRSRVPDVVSAARAVACDRFRVGIGHQMARASRSHRPNFGVDGVDLRCW